MFFQQQYIFMWYKLAIENNLENQLKELKPLLAAKAQEIYDEWDEDNIDEYAGGGICHYIADGFVEILNEKFPNLISFTISDSFEVHVYAAIADISEDKLENEDSEIDGTYVYNVDIHHSVYETGGGYSWKKIPNVEFLPEDVSIYKNWADLENIRTMWSGEY